MFDSFIPNSIFFFRNKLRNVNKFSAEYYGFNPNFSYFLLQASFGDKWMILSFMPEFLIIQKNARILASKKDRELIRIFIGNNEIRRAVIFIEDEKIKEISSLVTVNSAYSAQIVADNYQLVQTQKIIEKGLPKNIIRHLHIVKYPYFSDLHIVHGIPYADLLKMILYIPANSLGVQPNYYTDEDYTNALDIVKSKFQDDCQKVILFNVVNISHQPLSEDQVMSVLKNFADFGYRVLVNMTGNVGASSFAESIENKSQARCVNIPGHLLALVSDYVTGVFGVIGGAMCVATYFSKSHAVSIFTRAVGYPYGLGDVHAGKVSDNIWKIDGGAWPFIFPGRVAEHVDGENLSAWDDKKIRETVADFVRRI